MLEANDAMITSAIANTIARRLASTSNSNGQPPKAGP